MQGILKTLTKARELTASEREAFAPQLQYIDHQITEIQTLSDGISQIGAASQALHQQTLALHKQIDESNGEYLAMDAALTRFQGVADQMTSIQAETEEAWQALANLENKLLEHPLYCGLKYKGNNPDDIVFSKKSQTA